MLKTTLKNFFKNFILVFIPMGIIYLFLLLAIFFFGEHLAQNLSVTITNLSALLENTLVESESSLGEFISFSISKIDWHGDFLETLEEIFESGWMEETIKGFLATLTTSTEGLEEELNTIVLTFTGNLLISVVVVIILCVLGIFIADYVTRFFVRKHIAKRNFKGTILAYTLIPIFQVTAIVLFIYLFTKIQYFSLLVLILFVVLNNILSLISSWIIYKNKDLKLSSVLNVKNFFSSFLSTIIITLINIVLFVVLYYINSLIAFLLMVPIVIYSYAICDLQVDAYVSSLVANEESITN